MTDRTSPPGEPPVGHGAYPFAASRHALSILRFPDRRTAWVVLLAARLTSAVAEAELAERLVTLARAVPLAAAHLDGETWVSGAVPEVRTLRGQGALAPQLDVPFDLATEAPLRVGRSADGTGLVLAAHHAAFDGLSLVAVCDHLLGGALPVAVSSPPPGEAGDRAPLWQRLLRPADRVAPSAHRPPRDAYAAVDLAVAGRQPTARLAGACVAAVVARNRRSGARARKIGVSLSVSGPSGVGNVASYRRIDVRPGDDVRAAAEVAMASGGEPAEQAAPSKRMRLLEPVVNRFSDTVLVSNLGRQAPTGVERLIFHPVARGRSAVAFGLAGLPGRPATLTVRARDLTQDDAAELLDDVAARFSRGA